MVITRLGKIHKSKTVTNKKNKMKLMKKIKGKMSNKSRMMMVMMTMEKLSMKEVTISKIMEMMIKMMILVQKNLTKNPNLNQMKKSVKLHRNPHLQIKLPLNLIQPNQPLKKSPLPTKKPTKKLSLPRNPNPLLLNQLQRNKNFNRKKQVKVKNDYYNS